MLSYSALNSGLPVPVMIKTDGDFSSLINQLPICDFGQDVISCNQPIDMDLYLVRNVKNPVNKLVEANKAFADRIEDKTATGNIPSTARTGHILFPFLAAKAFASGKIIICEMWVERLAGEWIATSSPMFATAWPDFHMFSRGPSLMTFFSHFPPLVGLALFSSTI